MELENHIFDALQRYTKALSVALEHRDVYTRLHSDRVVSLSEEIGVHCKLTEKEINGLVIGATFHDIGKIGIPDIVLLKPSRLDETEWEIIKKHSEIGEQIMLATELEGAEHMALLIRQHHEYYNGMGYPDNLAGDDITICARIISIADGYDAISMTRSYHQARTHSEVMAILHEETGSKYDPELMHIFNKLIENSKYKAPDSQSIS
jgi:HD-GYP domain-containing protein (c-di-GMP phosphodiesterase class II)